MTIASVLQRLTSRLPVFININNLTNALLTAVGDETELAEAKIGAWSYGAEDVLPGLFNVASGSGSAVITPYIYSTGTVATVSGSQRVTGTGTQWLTYVNPGDTMTISGESATTVGAVLNDTTVDLTTTMASTASGLSYTDKFGQDFTKIWLVGDELVIAGSQDDNDGLYPVSAVSSASVTITGTIAIAETQIYCGETKTRLIRDAAGMLLFAGGYETCSQIRSEILSQAGEIHALRGSTTGVSNDIGRLTATTPVFVNSTQLPVLLQSGVSSTSGGAALTATTGLTVGQSFMVSGSHLRSNGRYFVYANSGTAITPARRPLNSQLYYTGQVSGCEVQFREDRTNKQIYFRVQNLSGVATQQITITVTAAGLSTVTAGVPAGASYTVSVSGNEVTAVWTLGSTETVREAWVNVGSLALTIEFQPTVALASTGTTVQAVRLGAGIICGRNVDDTVNLSAMDNWRWGGFVKTVLPSAISESGLSVLSGAMLGYCLGFSLPTDIEQPTYAIVSPAAFLSIETDVQNAQQYAASTVQTLAQSYFLPVDADVVLNFI